MRGGRSVGWSVGRSSLRRDWREEASRALLVRLLLFAGIVGIEAIWLFIAVKRFGYLAGRCYVSSYRSN